MKLWIDDAAWLWKRLWSVRLALIGVVWAAAAGYWVTAPAEWKPELTPVVRWILSVVGVALAASPGVAALVKQPKLIQAKEERHNEPA